MENRFSEVSSITPNVTKGLEGLTITISERGSISIEPELSEIHKFLENKKLKLKTPQSQ